MQCTFFYLNGFSLRHVLCRITFDQILILAMDQSILFQRIDHAVNRRHTDSGILLCRLIINLFTGAALSVQDHIDQKFSLVRDAASVLLSLF